MSSTPLKIRGRGTSAPKAKTSSTGANQNTLLDKSIQQKRAQIRSQVIDSQKFPPMFIPICPICRNPLRIGRDEHGQKVYVHEMHEVLITRGDVAKAMPEIKLSIHSIYNCVAVCPECHVQASTREGQQACIGMLIAAYGRGVLIREITKLATPLRGPIGDLCQNLIQQCPPWTFTLRKVSA